MFHLLSRLENLEISRNGNTSPPPTWHRNHNIRPGIVHVCVGVVCVVCVHGNVVQIVVVVVDVVVDVDHQGDDCCDKVDEVESI